MTLTSSRSVGPRSSHWGSHNPVSVHGALFFVDANLPLYGGSFITRGVEVCWPEKLAKQLDSLVGQVDVTAVASTIAARFPPA